MTWHLPSQLFEDAHLANCVEVVRDGAEALDYLFKRGAFCNRETGSPVVMLLDVKLPKVDGLGVLREIKADPDLKLIPIVMLTSSREEPDLKRSYQHGANAYVVKPVKFHVFVDAVKEAGSMQLLLRRSGTHC